ncbi:MAG: diguanylate cyclase [Herbinix sp.]|nr:diguanylate cyclase [Herbinix sp.]
MKIKAKVFLTALISLTIGVVCSVILTSQISLRYIENEENEVILNNYNKASLILKSEINGIMRTQLDWSHWDETYQYINGTDTNYTEVNLGEDTLKQLKMYGMIYLDKNKRILHSDWISDQDTAYVQKKINNKENILTLVKNVTSTNLNSGITRIHNKVFFISICGITNSKGTAGDNGYLIMLRKMDYIFVDYMENLMDAKIEFQSANAEKKSYSNKDFIVTDIERTFQQLNSRAGINDIINNNAIFLTLDSKRTSFQNAVETFKIVSIVAIAIFSLTLISCLISINSTVIKKVAKLNQFVDKVMKNDDVSLKINVKGHDEIANLSSNINKMLDKLDKNFVEIKKNDERLHLLMEATSDGYFDYDIKSRKIFISKSWSEHLGYKSDHNHIDYAKILDYIYWKDRIIFRKLVHDYLKGKKSDFHAEIRVYKADSEYIWVLLRGKIVDYDKKGRALRWMGSISDITRRKNTEQENIYLLQTDTVTNLKNRSYLENKLKELEEDKNQNYCVLMADVNGLKLINDTFGHKEGDRLLSTVGDIFRKCCSDTDIPVRWGGDEFLILVKNERNYVETLLQDIKQELSVVDSFPIKVSVAMGYSKVHAMDTGTDEIIKRAEQKMYRNKLLESRSVRSSIISSLEHSLHEKHIETHEHIERVKDLSLRIAKKLKFSQDILDELALLCVIHDIGKIALPDHVLLKPGKLTDEERKLMRTHTESGYRIARAITEISHISEKILFHHENYDGTGYPRGISKEEIPVISRVLAVAHDFDIKTYGNTYQEKLFSTQEALEELKVGAGSKYDPKVVESMCELLKTD